MFVRLLEQEILWHLRFISVILVLSYLFIPEKEIAFDHFRDKFRNLNFILFIVIEKKAFYIKKITYTFIV